ncbi:MAG: DUF4012 domain-containing protein [Acidimicrobiia bacterium]|nr:DUF4012 domain-containing protein [Acidimicrobiia bacterium]
MSRGELGGRVDSYLELQVADGHIQLADEGRPLEDLDPRAREAGAVLSDPDAYPERYLTHDPARRWRDLTASPDLPTVARAARDLWPQLTGRQIDGVLVIDPVALAGFVELIGPIKVSGRAQPLDSRNLVQALLRPVADNGDDDVNTTAPGPDEPSELLGWTARRTFGELLAGDLPPPRRLGEALSAPARGGHLQAHLFEPDERRLLGRLQLDGTFPDPAGGDLVAVTQANAGAGAVDGFVDRRVTHDVRLDGDDVTATTRVVLDNKTPTAVAEHLAAEAPTGRADLFLSVYTPFELDSVSIDGDQLDAEPFREHGVNRYTVPVEIPRRAAREVVFELRGRLEDPDRYRLTVVNQPLGRNDDVAVVVRSGRGTWEVSPPTERRIVRWRPPEP